MAHSACGDLVRMPIVLDQAVCQENESQGWFIAEPVIDVPVIKTSDSPGE